MTRRTKGLSWRRVARPTWTNLLVITVGMALLAMFLFAEWLAYQVRTHWNHEATCTVTAVSTERSRSSSYVLIVSTRECGELQQYSRNGKDGLMPYQAAIGKPSRFRIADYRILWGNPKIIEFYGPK